MNTSDMQKAFALATKASEDPATPLRERNYFRAIAHLIWRACESESSEQRIAVAYTADLSGFNHLDA